MYHHLMAFVYGQRIKAIVMDNVKGVVGVS